jgi:acyl-CoA dehydrogenase
MSWSFTTEPDYQARLDWADAFVREEVEPLELLPFHAFDTSDPLRNALIRPLQQQVRDQGLWACHLGPELGGPGFGQVKLALLNEVIGRAKWGPVVFGAQAPDSGNAEILARFGTAEQRHRYLEPLLAGDIVSAFEMTEVAGGADPTAITTRAVPDGDGWVLSGEKWFGSNARFARFHIVMAVTDPDAQSRHRRLSAFLVDAESSGIEFLRHVAYGDESDGDGDHAYLRFDVNLPAEALLGERGGGFVVAQTRLGGGRIHHAMRTIGQARTVLDMMCERAVSRRSGSGRLADRQLIEALIADSWTRIECFRLLVLQTAARIDEHQDYRAVRGDIAAVKAAMPGVLHDVVVGAMRVHGALGVSTELPLNRLLTESVALSLGDGPTEVHQVTVAHELLKDVQPAPDEWPSRHLPRLRDAAYARYADVLKEYGR